MATESDCCTNHDGVHVHGCCRVRIDGFTHRGACLTESEDAAEADAREQARIDAIHDLSLDPAECVSVAEAAQLLGLTELEVQVLISSGRLHTTREAPAGERVVELCDVQDIERNRCGPLDRALAGVVLGHLVQGELEMSWVARRGGLDLRWLEGWLTGKWQATVGDLDRLARGLELSPRALFDEWMSDRKAQS